MNLVGQLGYSWRTIHPPAPPKLIAWGSCGRGILYWLLSHTGRSIVPLGNQKDRRQWCNCELETWFVWSRFSLCGFAVSTWYWILMVDFLDSYEVIYLCWHLMVHPVQDKLEPSGLALVIHFLVCYQQIWLVSGFNWDFFNKVGIINIKHWILFIITIGHLLHNVLR